MDMIFFLIYFGIMLATFLCRFFWDSKRCFVGSPQHFQRTLATEVGSVTSDGESNWLEGAMLIAAYVMVGLTQGLPG